MNWSTFHNQSVENASLAQLALRSFEFEKARDLYLKAAEYELEAFEHADVEKSRTRGITIVSAISLFYKAHSFEKAEQLAFLHLANTELPPFAKEQLKDIVQTIWGEKEFEANNIGFVEGEVLVSVSGGDVVTGGAPLELILTKVNDISRYFYRTIEMLLDKPLRTRGAPERYIQEQCRPWLFQAPTGSYQFAVRVQRPMQPELFGENMPKIQHITDKFIQIIDAASREDVQDLESAVPNEGYRNVFLKMTRNLAPTGKTYSKLEIKPSRSSIVESVVLVPDSRSSVNKLIKSVSPARAEIVGADEAIHLVGTLRGLHLDGDWIEVTIIDGEQEKHIKVTKTGEVIDDIVGPMVNRRVLVDALKTSLGEYHFQDIQIDE